MQNGSELKRALNLITTNLSHRETSVSTNAYDKIRDSVSISDILTYHSINHKVNANKIGRCSCPYCKADDSSAFFFSEKSFHCFVCESRGGALEIEMLLSCVNTPRQAAVILARRHDIAICWPDNQHDKRRGLVHISRLLPPILSSSKLCRKAWDRQIGNIKTVRDTKAKVLSDLRNRWHDGKTKSDSEAALERELLVEIFAFDERISSMWAESNAAVASLRIQERGGNNE
jgi:hypothetical protein